jgi:hypothetical protein
MPRRTKYGVAATVAAGLFLLALNAMSPRTATNREAAPEERPTQHTPSAPRDAAGPQHLSVSSPRGVAEGAPEVAQAVGVTAAGIVELPPESTAPAASAPRLVANGVELFPSAAEALYSDRLGAALNEADQALQKCFASGDPKPHLDDGGTPAVTLKLTVFDHAGTGRVSDVQILRSDFDNPLVSQCLGLTATGLAFPAPQGRPDAVITFETGPN